MPEVFADIQTYIQSQNKKISIIIGNGLSRKFFESFKYNSLFEEAYKTNSPEEKKLFIEFGTSNFEEVLWNLFIARKVHSALDNNHPSIKIFDDLYSKIQETFIETIKKIHPTYSAAVTAVKKICDQLKLFQRVFTTNYDLLIYWAIMQDESNFTDRIVNDELRYDDHFEPLTHVYYLHGALHLSQNAENPFYKIKREDGPEPDDCIDLLTKILTTPNYFPIYVAEGTWQKKLNKIRSVPYLNLSYEVLKENYAHSVKESLPLVVYGLSLTETFDKHIIDAIKGSRIKTIFYGIHNKQNLTERFHQLHALFPNQNLFFFDSDCLFI